MATAVGGWLPSAETFPQPPTLYNGGTGAIGRARNGEHAMYHHHGACGDEHEGRRRAGLAALALAGPAWWHRQGDRVAALYVRRVGVTLGLAGCVLVGAPAAPGGAGGRAPGRLADRA